MELLQLTYKTSRISYIRFGSGPKLTFCFHGYGEDSTSFSFFEKYAGAYYTFFAMDLPYHGQTEWNDGLTCTTSDIIEIMERILHENNKPPITGSQQFSLMGFSLGGRVALSLYEEMPSQTEKIILLAPDGLKVNFWYWLATQSRVGNKLFAFTMKHPAWFFGLLKSLNQFKLVNTSIFKFVNYYIGDENVRQLLYKRWTGLRKLKPDLKKVKSSIPRNKTQVRLIYGKHDRIILPVRGEKFIKGMEENCVLSVIHSGHQVLHEKHVQEILPALLY
ncbi:MAG: alpha/beta hydrolase [Bacteroidota bacterium]|nr:alpha/beta hydrolase [Bacteroidota bacterium]